MVAPAVTVKMAVGMAEVGEEVVEVVIGNKMVINLKTINFKLKFYVI